MKLITVTYIPILINNYSWIMHNNKYCVIIDPGNSRPILKYIKKKWIPIAILITHYHNDHTQGIEKIVTNYPKIKVYSPIEYQTKFVTNIVNGSEKIYLLDNYISIINTPGHTRFHVSYYMKPYLFCGDVLFSAGCGRVYSNLHLQMYHSLKKISSLPEHTFICCGHEYAYINLLFAISQFPMNTTIINYFKKLILIKKNKKNVITTLKTEKKINIFLKVHEIDMQKFKKINFNKFYPWNFFQLLRKLKDNF